MLNYFMLRQLSIKVGLLTTLLIVGHDMTKIIYDYNNNRHAIPLQHGQSAKSCILCVPVYLSMLSKAFSSEELLLYKSLL